MLGRTSLSNRERREEEEKARKNKMKQQGELGGRVV
jgi:hypothetical protein